MQVDLTEKFHRYCEEAENQLRAGGGGVGAARAYADLAMATAVIIASVQKPGGNKEVNGS